MRRFFVFELLLVPLFSFSPLFTQANNGSVGGV